jgi:hypothetical protein
VQVYLFRVVITGINMTSPRTDARVSYRRGASIPLSVPVRVYRTAETWRCFIGMNSGYMPDSVDLSNKAGILPHKHNIGARSRNHCCCGKAFSVTYSKYVSATFVMQHAMCMWCVILSSVACLDVQYCSILFHKCHNFRKYVIEHKMYILIFSTAFVYIISHSKKHPAR